MQPLHAITGILRRLCNKNENVLFTLRWFYYLEIPKYFSQIFSKWLCIPELVLIAFNCTHTLTKPLCISWMSETRSSKKTYKLRSWFVWKGKWVFTLMTIFSWKTEDNIFLSWVIHIYNFNWYLYSMVLFKQMWDYVHRTGIITSFSRGRSWPFTLCQDRAKHHVSINSFTL